MILFLYSLHSLLFGKLVAFSDGLILSETYCIIYNEIDVKSIAQTFPQKTVTARLKSIRYITKLPLVFDQDLRSLFDLELSVVFDKDVKRLFGSDVEVKQAPREDFDEDEVQEDTNFVFITWTLFISTESPSLVSKDFVLFDEEESSFEPSESGVKPFPSRTRLG